MMDGSLPATRAQRWKLGRESWRHEHEGEYRKGDYAVDVIDEQTARRFTTMHHYSRSYPAAVARMGLFGPGAKLMGVAVFSVPMNQQVVPSYCAVPANQGIELGRFCLLDEAPFNSETSFLSGAFKLLRQEKPQFQAVVSYSDPVPRHSQAGELVLPGHIGKIYQAFNGRYVGRSSSRTLHLTERGQVISPRSVSKIRLQERGCRAAEQHLIALGAPAREFAQDPAEWVSKVMASNLFRRMRHPGCHVYLWPIGPSAQRRSLQSGFAQAKPYPQHIYGAATL